MIGYYIHDHGTGHRTRAQAIVRHLSVPVVALTSAAEHHTDFADVIRLDRDDQGARRDDVTAHGVLHWVPRDDPGLRRRMAQIAGFVTTCRPDAMVVDVSVEVTLFVRLMGVPVVVVAMPGDRSDPAHLLAYRIADAIIAPWPEDLYRPEWLAEHHAKTTFTGGISRYEGRDRHEQPTRAADVLVMTGTGGTRATREGVDALAGEFPQLTIRALGPAFDSWVDDPWPDLCGAGLVVINAGQSSVADVAVAGRRALVLPESRPFGEQHATAETVARSGLARVSPRWPAPTEWRSLLYPSTDASPCWEQWQTTGAAGRAAAAIEKVLAS